MGKALPMACNKKPDHHPKFTITYAQQPFIILRIHQFLSAFFSSDSSQSKDLLNSRVLRLFYRFSWHMCFFDRHSLMGFEDLCTSVALLASKTPKLWSCGPHPPVKNGLKWPKKTEIRKTSGLDHGCLAKWAGRGVGPPRPPHGAP